MIGGDVQLIEVIEAAFDLATEDGLEAHQREDIAELFDHLKDGMNYADAWLPSRKADVNPLGFEASAQLRCLECRLPLFE